MLLLQRTRIKAWCVLDSYPQTAAVRIMKKALTSEVAAVNPVSLVQKKTVISCEYIHSNSEESAAVREKNKALSHLIRNGRLRDARALFDGLPHRSVVTWNSMISGYVRRGELAKARDLFDKMLHRDIISWNTILLGYAMSKNTAEVNEGRKLFDGMPQRDIVTWNTMIRAYTRNRRMNDAMSLFEQMPERNSVSWNTIIAGFLENGDVENSVKMFDVMPVRDQASLSAVVSGLIRNGRMQYAEDFLSRRCRIGDTKGLVDAYNILLAGYGRQGSVDDANRIFNLIPSVAHRSESESSTRFGGQTRRVSENVITWNSMMMSYVKAGDMSNAKKLFDEMSFKDSVSWNTMISGYARALDVQEAEFLFRQMPCPDDRTWNSMIAAFSQKGDLDRARSYFDRMPYKNIVSWNSLIAGYDLNGDHEGAIELFSQMLSVSETPDQHTLSSVLSACANLATLNVGLQIHQIITKTFLLDIPTNNSLITMYARCGNLFDARSVFESMELRKDFISWNAMIGGYAQHGLASEALDLFEEMKRRRVKPTNITFISILNACCHAGLVTDGQKNFESMIKDYGMIPSVEHYALLVNLVSRNGHLEDAMKIIRRMVVPPDKTVWGALLDACKIHSDWNLARIAADAVMEVDPDSAGPHVLLYNMYADRGRWKDARKAREVLDQTGIKKQPGCSWIELNMTFHIFLAGDRSHFLSTEIYELISFYDKITRDTYLSGFASGIATEEI